MTFDERYDAAMAESFAGWDFDRFGDRLRVQRPPWDYPALVRDAARDARVCVDLGTGGGEFWSALALDNQLQIATECWPPNVSVAAACLAPRGVYIVTHSPALDNVEWSAAAAGGELPLRGGSVDLVHSRHEAYAPDEVARVLSEAGRFVTQQVGEDPLGALADVLGGPRTATGWNVELATEQLEAVGLRVVAREQGRTRVVFADVGVVIGYARMVPWAFPGFDPARDVDRLRALHERMEHDGGFETAYQCFWLRAERWLRRGCARLCAMAPALPAALIDATFEVHRTLNRAPRMAWGAVVDGALAHSGGHDADQHTAFRIASMTKSFTAALVLALRDDGVLTLDAPVRDYAPELGALRPPNGDAEPITLRHLLTMSSGLATDDAWADRVMDMDDAAMDAVIATGGRFAAPPGTTNEYSNLGYGLIGRVVRRATGATVQSLVLTRFLEPLGMTSTAWSADALPHGTDVATGYAIVDDAYVDEPPVGDGVLAPMAGLYSTVADLARWAGFLADAFPPRDGGDEGPLRRSSRREMQRVANLGAPGTGSFYGMGIRIDRHPALGLLIGHSGGLPGYGSNMRWTAEAGVGLIALANVTYARMADAVRAVFDVLASTDAIGIRPVTVDAALAAAAAELVALLDDWDDARAAALFTRNVALDDSLARRADAAARLRGERGSGFVIERIDAVSATTGSVRVRGARTSFVVDFELAPFGDAPRIQWYEIA